MSRRERIARAQSEVFVQVHVLWHTHDRDDDDEDVKFIGVFSSEASGRRANSELLLQPGFCAAREGFCLEAYEGRPGPLGTGLRHDTP